MPSAVCPVQLPLVPLGRPPRVGSMGHVPAAFGGGAGDRDPASGPAPELAGTVRARVPPLSARPPSRARIPLHSMGSFGPCSWVGAGAQWEAGRVPDCGVMRDAEPVPE